MTATTGTCRTQGDDPCGPCDRARTQAIEGARAGEGVA